MKDSEKNVVKKYELGIPWVAIILGLLAYAFWGTVAGVVTFALAYIGLAFLPYFGLVPVGGPFIYV